MSSWQTLLADCVGIDIAMFKPIDRDTYSQEMVFPPRVFIVVGEVRPTRMVLLWARSVEEALRRGFFGDENAAV